MSFGLLDLGLWCCLGLLKVFFFIFGLIKAPFGEYFLFFLGFLSKSKVVISIWFPLITAPRLDYSQDGRVFLVLVLRLGGDVFFFFF